VRPCEYGVVTFRHDRIAVVANGPTAATAPLDQLPSEVPIIAVNGAVKWLERADYWFTLDPSPSNIEIMQNRKAGTIYFAAVPPDFAEKNSRIRSFRIRRPPGVVYLRRGECTNLSRHPSRICTGNSGFGAFNLAVLMKPKRIILIGIDGYGRYANGPGRPGNLKRVPGLFKAGLPFIRTSGIEVRNGSPRSHVNCFPRCTPAEAIAWISKPLLPSE
jgi:hypothetical protein